MAKKAIYDKVDEAIATYSIPAGGPPLATVSYALVDTNGDVIAVSDSSGRFKFIANKLHTVQEGLTALAGGGQAGATAITADLVRFTTVATAADSGLLPAAVAGRQITVTNASANSMNVYPATGEIVNALSANAAYAIAAGKTAIFTCTLAGKWQTVLTA